MPPFEAESSVRPSQPPSERQRLLSSSPKRALTHRSMELVGSLGRRGFGLTNGWWVRRSLPTLVTAAAFLVGYSTLDRLFGPSGANVFVLVPIVAAAWSFGIRGGLVGGVVIVVLAGALSSASGSL